MRNIKLTTEAAVELEEAAVWYETECTGLGARLVEAFEHAVQLLREDSPPLTPVAGQASKLNTKRITLHKFPFPLIVLDKEETTIIVAFAHHARRPGYWQERVRT